MGETLNDVHNEFKRLLAWVKRCPVEAAMLLEELENKRGDLTQGMQENQRLRDGLEKIKDIWIEGQPNGEGEVMYEEETICEAMFQVAVRATKGGGDIEE